MTRKFLQMNMSNSVLDLADVANNEDIQLHMVELNDEGVNTLIAEISSIMEVTDEDNTLFISGDDDDQVLIEQYAKTNENISYNGSSYTQYTWQDTHLYVEDDITVNYLP